MGKLSDNLRLFSEKKAECQPSKSSHGAGRSSSNKSLYSLVPLSDVTPGALEVWLDLPEEIRNDPVLQPFREQYEKQHGSAPASTSHHDSHAPARVENGVKLAPLAKMDTPDPELNRNIFPDGNSHSHFGGKGHDSQVHPMHGDDTTLDDDTEIGEKNKCHTWLGYLKIGCLLAVWLAFTAILVLKNEKEVLIKHIAIPQGDIKSILLGVSDTTRLSIQPSGPFLLEEQHSNATRNMDVWLERVKLSGNFSMDNLVGFTEANVVDKVIVSEVWSVQVVAEEHLDSIDRVKAYNIFSIQDMPSSTLNSSYILRAVFNTNLDATIPVEVEYNFSPIDIDKGVIYAAIILVGLYVLIIFEFVHRTFAAILASTMAIAVLALLDERPSMQELVSWIDVETLLLLFSMMVLVAILAETGVFDFLAVYAYKVTGGRVWPLINCLCFFTAVLSSFLDNVTTVLLMTPVTIRLCEVLELNPVPILMAMVIYSNVGGTATPVGDPPNVIIASNAEVINAGVNFTNFTMHVGLGILLVCVQTYFQLRFMYRDMSKLRFSEPQDIRVLKTELKVWKRAAASLSSYSKDEDMVKSSLNKKVCKLRRQLKRKQSGIVSMDATYRENLKEMTSKYPIKDRVLLVKATIAVTFVVIVFFMHSIPELKRLSLGWTALLGAIMLLILADSEDLEPVIGRVEWTTLLFFAALFVLMEALSKLGLIAWIGHQTERIIMSVSKDSQLTVAILLLLWVSAIASAFVDNIPLTTMMVRVVTSLGNNPALDLPMQPLIWALAFGACLGGNGTLIGASANVVTAGVAEQHGYRFTFMDFFKIGFPMMLGSVLTSSVYLIICHVIFEWH